MTLLETIRIMEQAAKAQPAVNSIVENDVYRLNACPQARYGVFSFTQGMHRGQEGDDALRYSFVLFYVDRLTEDRRNEIEVQSVGIQTLDNILLLLQDKGVGTGSYTLQTFTQRFADECAGAYCTVTLEVSRDWTCAWDPQEDDDDKLIL